MPTGVYKRTAKHWEQIRRALAMGNSPEVREKARQTHIKVASDREWRLEISRRTKEALRRPDVRRRQQRRLKKIRQGGQWAKRGNGCPPTPFVLAIGKILEPEGFIREYPVKTKGHGTVHSVPTSYKVDFGNPRTKVAFELDGPSHGGIRSLLRDEKKTEVLVALGWRVFRVSHA